MNHFINRCWVCKKTINQCRCAGPKDEHWEICKECQTKIDALPWINIMELYPHHSGYQRGWVDDFYTDQKLNFTTKYKNQIIVAARYGHAMDYPKGFDVKLMERPS